MRKSFRYRMFTNKSQESKLGSLFDSARFLYNCALEQRIVCWRQWRKSINYYEQANALKEIRSFDEGLAKLNCSASQDILRRLDRAFQAFFRRIKAGDNPGFPRFKSKDRFDSITFPFYGDGVKVKNGKLYILNVGNVRIKFHREIEGDIKTISVKRQNGRFYACFSCDNIPHRILADCANEIGIDVGIKSFAALSNGETIDNPKHLKHSEDRIKERQRQQSQKLSKRTNKSLSRLHEKVANQRKDFLHKLSRKIVNRFGYIFIEDLKPNKMLNGKYKILNKYINDAAWSMFFDMLSYKAEEAGRVLIRVNPRGTTQTCSRCGAVVLKDLSVRTHHCVCGLEIDRDTNAAINILRLGHSLCLKQEAVGCG